MCMPVLRPERNASCQKDVILISTLTMCPLHSTPIPMLVLLPMYFLIPIPGLALPNFNRCCLSLEHVIGGSGALPENESMV